MPVRILAALTIMPLTLTLVAGPAPAAPAPDGQFPVSGVGTNNQITLGPDGSMWVTLDATNDLARITPDGTVTEYNPANVTSPVGITAGPDGNLWVTQANAVARFSPADPNAAVKFTINDITDPRAITRGPDGNLWTASADKVIKIPPANPAGSTAYSGTGVTGARWIASGTDGNLWVADFGGQQVVRVSTTGAGTAFPTGGGPQGVAAGPNGQVAFSDPTANPQFIGRITAPGPAQTTPAAGTDPFGVAFGADGAYWFAQFATNNLGRLTTDGTYSTLPLTAGSGPRQLAPGPNDTLWVTLDTAEKVARISGVSAPVTPTPQPTPEPQVTTTVTKKPHKVVRTSKPRARVKVRFTGTAGATYQCRLNKKPHKPWHPCTSPATFRLKPGKYRFFVRAVLNGVPDTTPAVAKFRIKRV
ncbi:MAG TPA: hypothetical protein PLT68_00530 [Actinomycetota bacterium]|nr:hypothetical protein [Actinomycetota bacterium]